MFLKTNKNVQWIERSRAIPVIPFLLVLIVFLTACGNAGGEEPSSKVETLIYANLEEIMHDREAVDRFNRSHDDIQIEIRDYFDEDGRRGIDRLLTEIAAGQIPDIIDLGYNRSGGILLPYQQLARKGYLEDLWPYIENDPELGAGALLEAPLKAAEVDGGLYVAFSHVAIHTLVGAESVVGDRMSWSLSELREAFSTMPEDSTVMECYYTKDMAFDSLAAQTLNNYVDWKTGQCSFDSEGFRTALEFVDVFPLEVDFQSEELSKRWMSGRQMLTYGNIGHFTDIQVFDVEFGGRASFVGYPVEDGSIGSYFKMSGKGRLVMSSTCRNKEAAWEYIRQLYLPESAVNPKDNYSLASFPVNRTDYEQLKKEYMNKRFSGSTNLWYGDIRYEFHPVTDDEVERLETFFNRIDTINLYDNALYNIVKESCGPYFAGDKTLDETISLIQNRVSLYVNENI